jgi:N-acetylglucosamine-6-sulfatase
VKRIFFKIIAIITSTAVFSLSGFAQKTSLMLPKIPNSKPYNIIYILLDDQRYDAMGFIKGQSFLETPHMDSIARNGVYLPNAFVTTALCSPSRASILTAVSAKGRLRNSFYRQMAYGRRDGRAAARISSLGFLQGPGPLSAP